MKKISIKLAIERPCQDGLCPIYVRVTIDRRKKDFPTGKKVPLECWDKELRVVKASSKFQPSKLIKRVVEDHRNKIEDIVSKLEIEDKIVTFDSIKRELDSGVDSSLIEYLVNSAERRFKGGEIKQATLSKYHSVARKIKAYDARVKVCDLSPYWIMGFRDFLLESVNAYGAYNYIKYIQYIARIAVKLGDLKSNPFDKIDPLKFKIKEREFLSIEELNRLDQYYWSGNLKRDWKGTPQGLETSNLALALFLVGCYCGLRKSDIKALRWAHIQKAPHGNSSFIQIDQRKTNQRVRIPVTPRLERILDSIPKESLLVFPRIPGHGAFRKMFNVVLPEIGVSKWISFHCSRHTFATACMTMGIPIEVVSKLCGHSDIGTTKIYARLVDQRIFEEMEKFDFDVPKKPKFARN